MQNCRLDSHLSTSKELKGWRDYPLTVYTSLQKLSKALLRDIVQKGSLQNQLTSPGIVQGRDHDQGGHRNVEVCPRHNNHMHSTNFNHHIKWGIYSPQEPQDSGGRLPRLERKALHILWWLWLRQKVPWSGPVTLYLITGPQAKKGHLDMRTNHSYYTQVKQTKQTFYRCSCICIYAKPATQTSSPGPWGKLSSSASNEMKISSVRQMLFVISGDAL